MSFHDAAGALAPVGRAVLAVGFDLGSDLDYGLVELYSKVRWEPASAVEVAERFDRVASFGEETDATNAGAMVVPLVAANDFTPLISEPA